MSDTEHAQGAGTSPHAPVGFDGGGTGAAHPLPRRPPSARGVDPRGIHALLDALEADPRIEMHGLMVVRGGDVVAEGWWAPYEAGRPHLLYSLSKTFTAAALGLAVGEGKVDLDATVLSHFPEIDGEVTDPRSRRMRVRHLAAMASGHQDETLDVALAADPDDLVRGFLRTPPEHEPGSWFAYNQPCTYTLARVVERCTGEGLTDYLRPRLLDPIGIGAVGWHRDHQGRELGFSGLHATTEDVARLGLLLLNRGVWRGRQVLPEGWVDEATRAHVATAGQGRPSDWSRGYGFQVWRSRHGYRGDGAYGQFCLVLPEHDLVLAATAGTEAMQEVLDAVWAHLVPALGPAGDGETSDDDALARRLAGLRLPVVTGAHHPPDADAWAGFHGSADASSALAAEMHVTCVDGRWRVDVRVDGVALTAEVGDGWQEHACALDDGGVLPVATSGAWDGDTLRLDLVFVETPHRLALTADPRARSVRGRWATAPLGDPSVSRLRSGPLRSPRM